ncbi:MAG: hypothetical protein JO001_26060 [Alphaproteobacteria bacterium]|nr:hypothetical protein [Alphaproteobacteria bacterium]
MKFTSPGGMFELSAELAKGLELVITDSGIGIKPAALERITTPFIQADSVDARDHQGTGLGLNLTKVLMEQHGGKLTLQSELGAAPPCVCGLRRSGLPPGPSTNRNNRRPDPRVAPAAGCRSPGASGAVAPLAGTTVG